MSCKTPPTGRAKPWRFPVSCRRSSIPLFPVPRRHHGLTHGLHCLRCYLRLPPPQSSPGPPSPSPTLLASHPPPQNSPGPPYSLASFMLPSPPAWLLQLPPWPRLLPLTPLNDFNPLLKTPSRMLTLIWTLLRQHLPPHQLSRFVKQSAFHFFFLSFNFSYSSSLVLP